MNPMKLSSISPNISEKQRLIRIIIACVILVLGWYYDSFWGGLVGVVVLASGVFGICPLCSNKAFSKAIPQVCDKK